MAHAIGISAAELWEAHQGAKRALVEHVNAVAGTGFATDTFTVGFARRATTWKRADLLFFDPERLKAIAARAGAFQLVFAGKAHPADEPGKALIRRVFAMRAVLAPVIKLVYLEDYDMRLARLLTSGSDLWLNTPQVPLEASGTSGMKAALNGVPSLSVLDGWWSEGCIEGVTGWAIGGNVAFETDDDRAADARSLYDKLERAVLPLFYGHRDGYVDVMRHAIALNGSFFNTERMLEQYVRKAYFE